MRLGLAAAFVALLACSGVSTTAETGSMAAFVYLHPAVQGNGRPVDVSAEQMHRLLTHHLAVPKDEDDSSMQSVDADAWNWLAAPPVMYKGRQVLTTADEEKQRTLVLLSGLDGSELDDVMPKELRNTHVIREAPQLSSFEALAESYGQQVYGAAGVAQTFAGFFVSVAEGMERALEGTGEWLLGHGSNALAASKQALDHTDAVDRASQAFYQGLHNFVGYLDSLDRSKTDATQTSYQMLRLSGLNEIKAAYGEQSQEFQRAKQALRDLLRAAVHKFDDLHATRPQSLALIVLPPQIPAGLGEEHTDTLQKRNRLLDPFRGKKIHTPFLSTRSSEEEGEALTKRQVYGGLAAAKPKPSKLPSDGTLASQCFKSEADLNKASQNCSGHGNATQTSRGGRKCYRCKCQTSKAKGGKLIDWTGEACQRQSIAKPFALLAFTTLILLIVSYASVYFLIGEGSKELPSVLAGISIPSKSR